jgi:hypothetical protein
MKKFDIQLAMAGHPVVTLDGRKVTDFKIEFPKAPQNFAEARDTENYTQGISAVIHNPTGQHRYKFYFDGTAHLYGGTTLSDLQMADTSEIKPVSNKPVPAEPVSLIELMSSFVRLRIDYKFWQLREVDQDSPQLAVMNFASGSEKLVLTSKMVEVSLLVKADLSEKISALIYLSVQKTDFIREIAHDVWNKDRWYSEMDEVYEFLNNKKLSVIAIRLPTGNPKFVIEVQLTKEGDLCQLP